MFLSLLLLVLTFHGSYSASTLRLNVDCGFYLTSVKNPEDTGLCKDVQIVTLDAKTWLIVKVLDKWRLQYDTVEPGDVIKRLGGAAVNLVLKTVDLESVFSNTKECVFDPAIFTSLVEHGLLYSLVRCRNNQLGLLRTLIAPNSILLTPHRSPIYYDQQIEQDAMVFGLSTHHQGLLMTYELTPRDIIQRKLHVLHKPEIKRYGVFKGRAYQYMYGNVTMLSIRHTKERKTKFFVYDAINDEYKEDPQCPALDFVDDSVFACFPDVPMSSDVETSSYLWITNPEQAGMILSQQKGDVDYLAKLNFEVEKCGELSVKNIHTIGLLFSTCMFELVNFLMIVLTFSLCCYCRKRKLYRPDPTTGTEGKKKEGKEKDKDNTEKGSKPNS